MILRFRLLALDDDVVIGDADRGLVAADVVDHEILNRIRARRVDRPFGVVGALVFGGEEVGVLRIVGEARKVESAVRARGRAPARQLLVFLHHVERHRKTWERFPFRPFENVAVDGEGCGLGNRGAR